MSDTEPTWEVGTRVKIDSPKEACHGRIGTVDCYSPSKKYLYVNTATGRVWVYPWELSEHKER